MWCYHSFAEDGKDFGLEVLDDEGISHSKFAAIGVAEDDAPS